MNNKKMLLSALAVLTLTVAGCGSDTSVKQEPSININEEAVVSEETVATQEVSEDFVLEDTESESIVSDNEAVTEDNTEENTDEIIEEITEETSVTFEGSCFEVTYDSGIWEDMYSDVKKGANQRYELMLGRLENHNCAFIIAATDTTVSNTIDAEIVKNQLELQLKNNEEITIESCESYDFGSYHGVKVVMISDDGEVKKKSETCYIMVRTTKLAISYTDDYDTFDEGYPAFQKLFDGIRIKSFL